MFGVDAGRVAVTTGGFGGSYGIATLQADGSDFDDIVDPGPARDQPHNGTEAPRWTPDGRILFDSNRAGGPDDWHIFIADADGGRLTQITDGPDGIENYPVMSADGSMLVFSKYLATPEGPGPFGGGGIFISDPDGTNERQVTAVPDGASDEFPEGAVDEWPDFSPDGQRIVFTRGHTPDGGLFVVNTDGSGIERLIDADFQALRPRWSPDGQWIVLHGNSNRFGSASANVWIVRPDGTELTQLTHESVPGEAWAPDWSPDGQHIVFVHTSSGGSTSLDVIGRHGTPTCTLWRGTGASTAWDPDWGLAQATESGRPIVADGEEWIVFGRQSTEPDGRSTGSQYLVRPDGTGEHRVVNDVIGSELRATWSPDGRHLAYIQATLDAADRDKAGVWVINADGTDARQLVRCDLPCNNIDYVDWGPDGNSIYFGMDSNAPDPESPPSTFEIGRFDFLTEEAGSVLTRENDGMTVEQPRISPDGSRVVYMRGQFMDAAAMTAIFVADLDGGSERQLTEWDMYAAHPDWSVDDVIVFNSYDIRLYKPADFPGARDLFTINSDGTDLRQLTSNEPGGVISGQARWAPDGDGITYTEWIGDRSQLAYIAADGSAQRLLTPAGTLGGEPEMRPTVSLVGEWEREQRCEEIVERLNDAGMGALALEHAAAFVPGASGAADIADPSQPCDGAVPLRHSHFFTADGRFGSRDHHGNQVDEGTYRILDDRTFVISNELGSGTLHEVTFHYYIAADMITFEPVIPECRPECFEAVWSVTVAYAGLPWTRVTERAT